MSRDYPQHPLPAVLAAVVEDGKLALVQRAKEEEPRRWGLPGGLIELGETPAQAAVRELAEETGLEAQAGPVIDQFDVVVRDDCGRVRTHYVVLVVSCRLVGGTLAAASDAAAAGWFCMQEITGLHGHPNLPRIARMLLAPIPKD
jgi:ADP-ribose pyrophosphatase YjhB (NUDIX family)